MIKVLLEQGEIVVEHLLHGPNVGVNKKHLLHKLMVDGFHFSVSHFDLWTNQTENQQRNIYCINFTINQMVIIDFHISFHPLVNYKEHSSG